MRRALGPNFYTGAGYLKETARKRNAKLYNEVAGLLPNPEVCPPILDLGCGVGYFAEILHLREYKNYTGIDFSKKMLNYAVNRSPYYKFIQANLHEDRIKKLFLKYSVFTMLETLEHVSRDLEILSAIPANATIIGSVPNRFCDGHVRIFPQIADVIKRYDPIIDFDCLREMNLNPKKKKSKVIIFRGVRRRNK